jgi:hypothetical protein
MSDTPSEPMFDYHCKRRRELLAIIADATSRLAETDATLAMLGDGRTRVRRRLKEAPALLIPDPPAATESVPFYRGVATPETPDAA